MITRNLYWHSQIRAPTIAVLPSVPVIGASPSRHRESSGSSIHSPTNVSTRVLIWKKSCSTASSPSAFRAVLDSRTGGATRCRNGDAYGIAILTRRPVSRVTGGTYARQNPDDPEQRAWLCVDTGDVSACTTHLDARSTAVARSYRNTSRVAFASLSDFVAGTRHLLAENGEWLAMKGRTPASEIATLVGIESEIEPLQVPGLAADRCIVWMRVHYE